MFAATTVHGATAWLFPVVGLAFCAIGVHTIRHPESWDRRRSRRATTRQAADTIATFGVIFLAVSGLWTITVVVRLVTG